MRRQRTHLSLREFSIRQATNFDEAGILECLHAAFEDYRGTYTSDAYLDTVLTHETLRHRLGEMDIFVATNRSGRVVGTIACNVTGDGEGHVRGMAVFPDWQGSGVATRLLSAVESQLRQQKCNRVTLDTTPPLSRAMRFYEKNGFRRSGRVSDFFGMPLFEYVKTIPG